MKEILTFADFKQMLCEAAELIIRNEALLTDIDARFGDGDHGITMKKVANVILEGCARSAADTVSELCDALSMEMMCVSGGSASALWGSFFQGFSKAGIACEITASDMKVFLVGGLNGLREISTAQIGDKTMMDALIPAVEAAQTAKDDLKDILSIAAAAAEAGKERSKQFVSRFGRAKSYGAQTIGVPDAGAASMALFFEGLWKGYGICDK